MIETNFEIEVHQVLNGQDTVNVYKSTYEQDCGCSNRMFNLILMDIQMPVLDGIEASRQINEYIIASNQKVAVPTHIVAISSYQVE
jgi:CheY-like chemotaxis protein